MRKCDEPGRAVSLLSRDVCAHLPEGLRHGPVRVQGDLAGEVGAVSTSKGTRTVGWKGGRPVARRGAQAVAGQKVLAVSGAPDEARQFRLEPLVAEYLLNLQVMGRSPRTLAWYREKLTGFLAHSEAITLADLTALALKQHIASMQGRDLARTWTRAAPVRKKHHIFIR